MVDFFNQAAAFLNGSAVAQALSVLAAMGLLDAVLRLKQSEKPLSVLRGVQAGLKAGIKFAQALDSFLDKLIPQRLAAPNLPESKPAEPNSDGK